MTTTRVRAAERSRPDAGVPTDVSRPLHSADSFPPLLLGTVPADALGLGPAATGAVLRLQGTAGNQHVQRLLHGDGDRRPGTLRERIVGVPTLQRADVSVSDVPASAPPVPQPVAGASAGLPLGAAARGQARTLRGRAAGRVAEVALYDAQANLAFSAYGPKRLAVSRSYRSAFDAHVAVLGRARAAAERQNMIESVVIGAVASAVVGVAAAALLPAAVLTAAATSAATIASVSAQGVLSSSLGTAVTTVVASPTGFDPVGAGSDDELEAWRALAALQAQARQVSTLGAKLGMHLGNTEYAIAQVDAHLDGGKPDANWDQTLTLVSDLMAVDRGMTGLDGALPTARAGMATLYERAAAMAVPGVDALEQQIWVVWVSGLADPDLLDRNAIEDHLHRIGVLGSGSLLGVDFGAWTSGDDEEKAVAAAQRLARQMQGERYAAARP